MATFAELQAAPPPSRSFKGQVTRTPDQYTVRGGVTPPYKQSERTSEQIFVLQRELENPDLNDEDREGIERELARLGGEPAKPKAKATPVSFSELAGTPATPTKPKEAPKADGPRSELDIQLGGVAAGARAVTNEAATLADMLLNTPTSVVGIGANVARRLGGIIKGEDRKTTAKEAHDLQRRIESTAPDLAKKFVRLFPTPPGEPAEQASNIEKAMGTVMEWSDTDAKNAEERSGGAIKAEDVMLWRDTALAMLGMKGITAPTKAAVKRAGEKIVEEARPPVELEGYPTPEAPAPKAAPTVSLAELIDQNTGVSDVAARTTPKAHKARQEEISGAFKEDPQYADYFRNLVEEELRLKQAEATRPQRLAEAEGVTAPRTGSAEPAILTPEGKIDTSVIGQRSLDTGLDKIAKGQSFNLTATEKVAIRDNAKQWGNRIQQAGKVDPELLKLMGSAGVGAVVGAYLLGEEDITGATLGAVGGLMGRYAASRSAGVRQLAQSAVQGLDNIAGLASTRVKNMSESAHHRMVELMRQEFRDGHRDLTVVTPFLENLEKVPKAQRAALDAAILTNDPVAIRNAMRMTRVPGLLSAWTDVRNLLDQRGKESVDFGILKGLRDDYFPRVVKDVEGLLNHLGLDQRTALEKKLLAAENASMQATGQPLTPEARSAIINKALESAPVEGEGRGGFRKERAIGKVTPDMLQFYESPTDSLIRYIRSSSKEHAKARFFNKNAVRDANGNLMFEDSIGALVEAELAAKKITGKQAEELKSIIRSVLGPGERAPAALIQDAKNLGYTSLLGHPTSALVQLGDVATTAFTQGLVPTVEAVMLQIRGKGVKAKDFGLMDHIAEEMASSRATAKLLNGTLKVVGFAAIDRFGKNNALTAAKVRHQRLARTAKGQADITRRYGEAFGSDLPQLISDLAARRDTDLVNSLLFHELSRQQPISRIETPQASLNNPNARVVYMLKTFMLKQADLARREAYNEIKKGNIAKGARALVGLGLVWGTMGATSGWVRDWILGKEVEPSWDDAWEGIFKTFGWSSYVLDKAEKGEPIQAAIGTVTPPIQPLDDIARTSMKLAGDDEMKTRDFRGVQHIPVVGRLAYNHLLGGAEHSNKQKQKREKAAERKRLKAEQEN